MVIHRYLRFKLVMIIIRRLNAIQGATMNIGIGSLFMQYTAYNFQPGRNNFVNRFINDTKKDFLNIVDIFNGKTKAKCQYEMAKLYNQIEIIEKNLNSSHNYSPKHLDILR